MPKLTSTSGRPSGGDTTTLHHGYVKLYTIGLWQMMYMDSADDGADDVHGGPDDGWPRMGTMLYMEGPVMDGR